MIGYIMLTAVERAADAHEAKGGSSVPYIVTILVAVFSSAGFWGVVTWLLGIRERRRKAKEQAEEDAKQKEEEKEARERREREEREENDRKALEFQQLLSQAQKQAQITALESADQRYAALHDDYARCCDGLKEIRKASFKILDALETVAGKLQRHEDGESYVAVITASEVIEIRDNIREARDTLYNW